MSEGHFRIPQAKNESVLDYRIGSPERIALKEELERQAKEVVNIPIIIDNKKIYTDRTVPISMPHNHKHVIAQCSQADEPEIKSAVSSVLSAHESWGEMSWEHRAAIFLKAAELVSKKYRAKLCAATMLGQSKTAYQAEIDVICELVDFLRFNASYIDQIYSHQPQNSDGIWNRLVYRPLEGFVLAVSPFNFTSIGSNLCTAPAMAGNTVIWKPAAAAVLSSYYVMEILIEAGLPPGVINFVPTGGENVSRFIVSDPNMAGFHFTGSNVVFENVWRSVGQNIQNYRSFPRLVGETGGKDYIFAHSTADVKPLCAALIRGAFEYQGQKCSAPSRAFIPESIWPELKDMLLSGIEKIKVGDIRDFRNFMGAVIDRNTFETIKKCIEDAQNSPDAELLCGGCDDSVGYFIHPTVILAKKKEYKSMIEEIFGPILTIFVYPDEEMDQMIKYCDSSTPYALTGGIFARDRDVIVKMERMLKYSAGNFYINDKPTGAVVGQQPFGGARGSGTNDKAGGILNLYRWMSVCTVKENFNPSTDITYPFMLEE